MSNSIPIKPHEYCLFCYLKNSNDQPPPPVTLEHLLAEHYDLGLHSLDGYHLLIDTLIINDHFAYSLEVEKPAQPRIPEQTFDDSVAVKLKSISLKINTILINKPNREQMAGVIKIEEFLKTNFSDSLDRLPPESELSRAYCNNSGYYEKKFTNFHTMIWIPPTRFTGTGEMLPGFWIDKYPVTNKQYKSVKPRKPVSTRRNHPVVNVDWYEVIAYCQALNFRPPTEIEWEQTATGGDGRWYPWGGEFDAKKCNTYESELADSTPVDTYPEGASPYGVMDLVGNVWEWCAPRSNTRTGWMILRGGSWNNTSISAHCNARLRTLPSVKNYNVGFRCARSPETNE